MTELATTAGGPEDRSPTSRGRVLIHGLVRSQLIRRGALCALILVLLLSGVGLPGLASGATTSPAAAVPTAIPAPVHPSDLGSVAATRPASGIAPLSLTPLGIPSSGRGVFFTKTEMPAVPTTNQTCQYLTYCYNDTNNPALNLTSAGTLALAYTAYNSNSSCPNFRPFLGNYFPTQTLIGFVRSTNGGASWSAPTYLGNPDCTSTNGSKYPSAYEPTLTSLANGTLVLAYIEYNMTNGSFVNYQSFGPYGYNVPYDRLVVTKSFNGGLSWTTPAVINASVNLLLNNHSYAPQRPWITASGKSVYLTWFNYTGGLNSLYNFTNNSYTSQGSAGVHIVASLDGGVTWGAPVSLRTFPGNGASFSINPMVITLPNGNVTVAYVTNVSFIYPYPGFYAAWIVNLEVAQSATNGSSFTYFQAVHGALLRYVNYGGIDPSPQLAYSPATKQLFMAYTAMQIYQECYTFGCYNNSAPSVYLANSSDNGLSWHVHEAGPHLMGVGTYWEVYNPALAVNATGGVDLAVTYYNNSICQLVFGFKDCGATTEAFLESANNGTSFAGPYLVTDNYTIFAYAPEGQYATMVTAGGHVWLAWSHDYCPAANSTNPYNCFTTGVSRSLVTVASLFSGTGITLTFAERGVASGVNWWIDLMGNGRAASAPTSLSVSGVPTNQSLVWNVSTPQGGYGIRYFLLSQSPAPPATFFVSTTIYENFTKQVLLQISTVPPLPALSGFNNFCGYGFYWNQSGCPGVNYNVTPIPGPDWVNAGATVDLNVSAYPISCWGTAVPCFFLNWYAELNLTFLAWNGTGAGSVNTTSNFTSVVVNAPLNETASFQLNGWCGYNFPSGTTNPHLVICLPSNQSFTFQEQGLPAGTKWGVTISGSGATESGTNTTSQIVLRGAATAGTVNYWAWTIPSATPGFYWVPTATPLSPVTLPLQPVVTVRYTLQAIATQSFPTVFSETGLPSGSSWSAEVGSAAYRAVAGGTATVEFTGSAPTNGSYVYGTNGTAYYASSITVDPLVVNSSSSTAAPPVVVTPVGPTFVTVHYSPMYRLTVAAGTGGSAGPPTRWVVSGAAVTLSASANAGYYFVGWSGAGPGSTNATQDLQLSPTIHPTGPVSELATFALIPPPVWTVSVQLIGLPAGMAASLALGSQSYSGGASFAIAGLASGTYSLSIPDATPNGTVGARYVPTGTSTSYSTTGTGALVISSNGTLNITYSGQFQLTTSSTGRGSVFPNGSAWYSAGAPVTLTATPGIHSKVAAWVGSGSSSVTTGSQLSVGLTMNSPVTEVVQFIYNPPTLPATFQLTVTASGLPGTVVWSVAVAGNGAAGVGNSLVIGGLNGSYTVEVPTVYVGLDERYVPASNGNYSKTVTANSSLSVAFTHEFLVTVDASAGGSASASVWAAVGSTVKLTATANATSEFVNWTGTVVGTSPTLNITVTGPTTETANFAAIPVKVTPTSATDGLPTTILILAVLLVAGVALGVLATRRRGRPPVAMTAGAASTPSTGPAGAGSAGPPTAPPSGEDWEEYGSTAPVLRPDWKE